MNYHRKIKIFFMDHWVKLLIGASLTGLIILSYIGLQSLESYYRNITLAQMPIQILMGMLHAVVFVYMYMSVFRGGFSKMQNKKVKAKDVEVRFGDVVGVDEAKEECWEVVQLIKDHKKLRSIGGKILRGVLMIGPPGCGKTYLAKAIATESGLPFISMAASEFNEIFVGVGASRVRQLFKKASRLAYANGGCIIFIDELDAMGQKRSFNQFGSGEGNTTQNQLLVAMDGLGEKSENIIVIGATNASESVLDDALLRPGRFDRKVYIRKPNLDGREAVFRLYLDKVKHDESVDVKRLARKAIDKSPAEIENIVKESALIAARNKSEVVRWADISEAIERIELGVKQKITMTDKEREMTAYHETGHLITTFLLHPRNDVFKASIIPRRGTLGVVHSLPQEEWHGYDRETLYAYIKTALGGYAAEKVKFKTTTSGVSSDFKQAMSIAYQMVWQLGMGPSGLIGDYTIYQGNTALSLADDIKQKLNDDVNKILTDALNEVEELLTKEKDLFERFANELLEKEELEYDDIEAIFAEYGKENPRKFSSVGADASEAKEGPEDSKYMPPSSEDTSSNEES